MIKKLVIFLLLVAPLGSFAAWSSVGVVGTVQNGKVSSSTLTIVTTNQLDAGNIGMLIVAKDNKLTASKDNSNESTAVTDSAGNTWTKVWETTGATTTPAAGATNALWYTKAASNLPAAGTIVMSFGFSATSAVTAAAASAWEFSFGAGSSVSVAAKATTTIADGSCTCFGTSTISGLTSGEYLFFRSSAMERDLADGSIATKTIGYTTTTPNGTTGGGTQTNMQAVGEFRIFTGTGDTSSPVASGVGGDRASVYAAFLETPAATTQRRREVIIIE